ncbi:MAG TPA: hypothetical protein VLG38_01560, partial [Gammaproteobacteria bacterium]|nr:hypothetical protein [Gammaproteobacteria bacterium]
TGFRMMLFDTDPWFSSSGEVRSFITYDFVSPSNAITANFLVGSNNFIVTSGNARTAVLAGADLTVNLCDWLQTKVSYDFEYRSGYRNSSGSVKLIVLL